MAKILNFKVIIEQDEDGYFVASVPGVPGCHTQGKSYEEALKNIKEALELCLEVADEKAEYKAKITFPQKTNKERFLGIVDLPVSVPS